MDRERRQHQRQCHRPLRQQAQPRARCRRKPPATMQLWRQPGDVGARERRRRPQREQAVRGDESAAVDELRRQEQHQPRDERGPPAGDAPRPPMHDRDRQHRDERGADAGGPIVDAEDAVRGHDEPIEQRRLVEVVLAVEDRHQPAVGGEHLPRDFGVAHLLRFQQWCPQAGGEEQDGEREQPSHAAKVAQARAGVKAESGLASPERQRRVRSGPSLALRSGKS